MVDVVDLSNRYGALSLDAGGARYQAAKPYQHEMTVELTEYHYLELLRHGYVFFVGDAESPVK